MTQNSTKLLWITRILVGLLFIFSGLIKLNDPLGFSYKLEEYFEVFHIVFINPLSVFISITLCALEVILGLFLLAGFYAKKVAWGLLLLIVFFTFLTFYSAAFDVVKTCGCFGDAIPLTPWQSFTKDLILLVLIVYVFINKNSIQSISNQQKIIKTTSVVFIILPVLFGLYSITFLPILDFLPYKEGANIIESMKIPEGSPQDEFEIIYTLKNKTTGEKKEINDKDYIATKIYADTNWVLESSSEPKLVKEGFQPKIKDLNVFDSQGVSYTQEIFDNPYYNLVAVGWKLDKTNKKALGDINALAINAKENFNTRSVFLTSNSPKDAEALVKELNLLPDVFYADAVPLKSMVRSNPGLMLIKEGVVIKKWPSTALPSYDDLVKNYLSKP
jgi:uncharacterized membrane protein YphA (DoxX/SURF4 family)